MQRGATTLQQRTVWRHCSGPDVRHTVCGDSTQLQAPSDTALFCKPGNTVEQAQDCSVFKLYQKFDSNFELERSLRQDGAANVEIHTQLKLLAVGTNRMDDWNAWSERCLRWRGACSTSRPHCCVQGLDSRQTVRIQLILGGSCVAP